MAFDIVGKKESVLDTNLLHPMEPSLRLGEGLHHLLEVDQTSLLRPGILATSQKVLEPPLSDHGSHEEGA